MEASAITAAKTMVVAVYVVRDEVEKTQGVVKTSRFSDAPTPSALDRASVKTVSSRDPRDGRPGLDAARAAIL